MLHWIPIALAIAGFGFALVWAICVRVKNYSFLDVAWSYGVAVLAPLYACTAKKPKTTTSAQRRAPPGISKKRLNANVYQAAWERPGAGPR